MIPVGFIYLTTCLLNNKIYIGQRCFSKNKYENKIYLGSGLHIKRAIKKYGRKNFKRKILEICFSNNDLNQKEEYYIQKYDSRNPQIGYNISAGGIGYKGGELHPYFGKKEENPFYGKKHTDEIKKKIGEKNRGKISANKGKKMSYDAKMKMSISAKKRMSNPLNNPMFGKHHTQKSNELNRQKHLNKKLSEETKKENFLR